MGGLSSLAKKKVTKDKEDGQKVEMRRKFSLKGIYLGG